MRNIGQFSEIASKIVSLLQEPDGAKKLGSRLIKTLLRIEISRLHKTNIEYTAQKKNRFLYQDKYVEFSIGGDEKVLDIGCGDDPFPLATHLCDRYLSVTSHRPDGSKVIRDTRPLTKCNALYLPYRDSSFDFVFCSHILEHVADPVAACEEMMRVGTRGYIETPTRLSDIIFNFTGIENHHRWHIVRAANTLVFFPWNPGERRDTHYNGSFEAATSKWQNEFQHFYYNNRDLFSNMMIWDKSFGYLVLDENGKIAHHNLAQGE